MRHALAAIIFAVLAAIPIFEGARDDIRSFVFENFMPDAGERIAEYFAGFVDNAGSLTTIGNLKRGNTAISTRRPPLRPARAVRITIRPRPSTSELPSRARLATLRRKFGSHPGNVG